MCRTQLWLLAFLVFSYLTSLADGSPMKLMSAPNVLRVGTSENIFVECQDCTDDNNITVKIIVMNYPTKTKRLTSTSVTLTSATKFQDLGQIKIPAGDFSKDPNMKQYVYLQAQFPDAELEKLVLVSFQSGYIFIQTDKTLYTPNSKVHYRMFAVSPRMEPVERDIETRSDAFIAIEIVTPEGIILPLDPVSLKSGIHSGDYQLAEIVSIGLWKVVAKFHSKPQLSYSAEFEVKEYVLPSFEVKLMLESPFFYVDSQELTINIKATYLFGQEVDGMAYGVFGVMHEGQKHSFPSSLQRVPIQRSNGVVTLKKEHITQPFKNILDLVGSSIFVAVGVLTESGSEMVEAELRGIQIVTSPYTIHFKNTAKYFKPGMSFDITVEVVNPDGTPAQGVEVVVDPGEVRGLTAANGMARLSINTEENPKPLTVTVSVGNCSNYIYLFTFCVKSYLAKVSQEWILNCQTDQKHNHLTRAAVQAAGRDPQHYGFPRVGQMAEPEEFYIGKQSVEPPGLFGIISAYMQWWCKERKIEGEALQLCLSRKTQIAPSQLVCRHSKNPSSHLLRWLLLASQ